MALPADLLTAEEQALTALREALAARSNGRWTVELRFEGLRVLPVALRLLASLSGTDPIAELLFTDAGGAALARRDAPELAPWLGSLGDRLRHLQPQENASGESDPPSEELHPAVLVLVAPAQADYAEVEQVCRAHGGAVVILNGRLEDAAVGIGSVARERRRGFLSTWEAAYALLPRSGSALRRAFPGDWELYRQDPDGFRLAHRFDTRPDTEAVEEALGGDQQGLNVGAGLGALDRFIEGLRS
jgi:hypothetical protein